VPAYFSTTGPSARAKPGTRGRKSPGYEVPRIHPTSPPRPRWPTDVLDKKERDGPLVFRPGRGDLRREHHWTSDDGVVEVAPPLPSGHPPGGTDSTAPGSVTTGDEFFRQGQRPSSTCGPRPAPWRCSAFSEAAPKKAKVRAVPLVTRTASSLARSSTGPTPPGQANSLTTTLLVAGPRLVGARITPPDTYSKSHHRPVPGSRPGRRQADGLRRPSTIYALVGGSTRIPACRAWCAG